MNMRRAGLKAGGAMICPPIPRPTHELAEWNRINVYRMTAMVGHVLQI